MEDPSNVFSYQHQLALTPESSYRLRQRVKRFVVKEKKLNLALHGDLREKVFLDVLGQLIALLERSQIEYFW